MRIATIGDVHGCITEFRELLSKLSWLSLDAIWCLADLVDRGPDSGAVVETVRTTPGVESILGNHDETIVKNYYRRLKSGQCTENPDKIRTLSQLATADIEYLEKLSPIKVFDDLELVLTHGGVWPSTPWHLQPKNIIRAQMINPSDFGQTRWWGNMAQSHKSGKSEADSRTEGYSRWYELYDHPYRVAFGHSVFAMPKTNRNPGAGLTVGLDTGCCFGGALTAGIWEKGKDPWYVSVRAKESYAEKHPLWVWES